MSAAGARAAGGAAAGSAPRAAGDEDSRAVTRLEADTPTAVPAGAAARAQATDGGSSPPALFDMHCHLDFDPDPAAAAQAASRVGLGGLSATVQPSDYARAHAALAPFASGVRAGLGLHPWWVDADAAAREAQLAAFERLAANVRFVGEVGLDFGRAHVQTAEAQRAAFERVAASCADGGRVLTIHAVRAAGEVVDALERAGAARNNACILHWFSGTSDELQRALQLGFYCSINPRMPQTRRGRAYARAIPASRLLLETDAPDQGASYDAPARAAQLSAMIGELAALRGDDARELAATVAATSRRLLGIGEGTAADS